MNAFQNACRSKKDKATCQGKYQFDSDNEVYAFDGACNVFDPEVAGVCVPTSISSAAAIETL